MIKTPCVYNLYISALVQNVKSSKARQISGKILLEGERLIADALKAGAHADAIFFSNSQHLDTFPLKQHPSVELYQVNYEKIQLWSDVTTSPGVLGKIIINYNPRFYCNYHIF